MNISSNPERILLNLHPTTRLRMKNALLPIGVSRTKWINLAICEKLDRDQPQTAIQHGVQKKEIMAAQAREQARIAALPPVPDHLINHPVLQKRWRAAGSPMPEEAPSFGPIASPYAQEALALIQGVKPDDPEDFWG
jgi:hypothetical protein